MNEFSIICLCGCIEKVVHVERPTQVDFAMDTRLTDLVQTQSREGMYQVLLMVL